MKVLLWGIESPWTINFVMNFLLENGYEVYILNRGKQKETKITNKIYKQYGTHIIEFPTIVTESYHKNEGNFIKFLYIHFLFLKTIIMSGPFDLINMQYVEYADLIDAVIVKFILRTKLILSYWGSDLLRAEGGKLNSVGKFSKYADFVTFDNIDLELKYKELYKWAGKIPQKTVMLGLPVLDIIKYKSDNDSKDKLRKKWGIDEGKVVIAIGYNGIPEQQHKKVLGALEKLDNSYKEKIVLLLQMSYGGSRSYRNSVIIAAKKTGFQYIDIQRFLTDDEVAEIRLLTDVFINAQVTDAFSGSVCENLFAGAVLINAGWLHYNELKKYDFRYLEFKSFNTMNEIVQKSLEEKIDVEKNKDLIWKLRSWETCAPKWKKIYRRTCNCGKNSGNFGRRKRYKASPLYHCNTKASGSYSR